MADIRNMLFAYLQQGHYGETGAWGPSGEPGMPATYCASDCGISKILAPFAYGFIVDQDNDEEYMDSTSR